MHQKKDIISNVHGWRTLVSRLEVLSKIERLMTVRMVPRRCACVRFYGCSRGCGVGSRGHRPHRTSLNERRGGYGLELHFFCVCSLFVTFAGRR